MGNFVGNAYFYLLAALSVAGALVAVGARNPIRGAMGLLLMILCIAGLFLALHAEFLAVIQLIVYAGAIVVLFLFVIMLLGPDATPGRDKRGHLTRTFAGTLFGLASAAAMYLAYRGWNGTPLKLVDGNFGGVDAFGAELFTRDLGPFELSSALLMVAVVGAVAVARGKSAGHKKPETETDASGQAVERTHA